MKDYIYIIVPFMTVILAQVIKFTIESIRDKKLRWGRLFNGNGGMPSSHTSFTFSLAFTIGYLQGFNSPIFAVVLVFSIIVAYDAMGLRMESSKHAVMLNRITEELFEGDTKEGFKLLKEQLGHKPLEVLMGIVLGIITSTIMINIL